MKIFHSKIKVIIGMRAFKTQIQLKVKSSYQNLISKQRALNLRLIDTIN